MPTLSFDTLQYAKRMQSAGMEPHLAEAQAQALADALREQHQQLVTREFVDARLNAAASDIKADVIKWVAGMLVAQAAVVATLVKLL